VFDHLLRRVLVFPNDQVHVVGEDGAGVAGVLEGRDRVGEADGNGVDRVGYSEVEQGELQQGFRLRLEVADVARRGLECLATVVYATERLEEVALDVAGATAAGVVGEPPSVGSR
jgi:hypothetical protein